MAVAVVDVLEVVDVEDEQRELAAETAHALELAAHVAHEIAAVVRAGERVRHRHAAAFLDHRLERMLEGDDAPGGGQPRDELRARGALR